MLTLLRAVVLSLVSVSTGAIGAARFYGEINDPVGDFLLATPPNFSPDIVFASIAVDESNFVFRARFAGLYDPARSRFDFDLDIDQSASTGAALRSGLGIDYTVGPAANVSVDTYLTAGIYRYSTSGPALYLGNVPMQYAGNEATMVVPRSLLGGDEGAVNWEIVSQAFLGGTIYSPLVDWAPNSAPPFAQTLAVPELPTQAYVLGGMVLLAGMVGRRPGVLRHRRTCSHRRH